MGTGLACPKGGRVKTLLLRVDLTIEHMQIKTQKGWAYPFIHEDIKAL